MIPMAARSFTLPPGFRYSSLAKTSADPGGTSRVNFSMGVSPTNWVMSSATRRRDMVVAFRTLQTMEVGVPASMLLGRARLFRKVGVGSCSILPCVVSALGAHGQLAVALRLGVHTNGAIPAGTLRIRWLVPQRVLVADIVRHVPRDRVHFIQTLGEKCDAPGLLRDELQRLARPS